MSAAAARMRRLRDRVRAGRIVLQIEVGESEVDALYDAGLLHGDDVEDRAAVAAAIERLVGMLSRYA